MDKQINEIIKTERDIKNQYHNIIDCIDRYTEANKHVYENIQHTKNLSFSYEDLIKFGYTGEKFARVMQRFSCKGKEDDDIRIIMSEESYSSKRIKYCRGFKKIEYLEKGKSYIEIDYTTDERGNALATFEQEDKYDKSKLTGTLLLDSREDTNEGKKHGLFTLYGGHVEIHGQNKYENDKLTERR